MSTNICAWCGQASIDEVEIEPPVYRTKREGGKSIKVIAKRAITASVCPAHRDMVDRNRIEQRARKEAAREAREKAKQKRAA